MIMEKYLSFLKILCWKVLYSCFFIWWGDIFLEGYRVRVIDLGRIWLVMFVINVVVYLLVFVVFYMLDFILI